jgi:mono/diheme cytochrome c family protein
MLLAAAAVGWYQRAIPGWAELSQGYVTVLPTMVTVLRAGALAVFLLGLWPLLAPRTWNPLGVVLLLAAGLGTFGAGEWIREAGRRPFTIKDYMYSTGMRVADQPQLAADGMAAHTLWLSPLADSDDEILGGELFRAHCSVCHTWNGYRGLYPFLAHWNRETIASLVPRLQHLRGPMPPWYGNDRENAVLTEYLLAAGATSPVAFPGERHAAEKLAWDLSCGLCHTLDGWRPLREFLAGQSRQELQDLLEMVGDLTPEMPPYYGSDQQRESLLSYLSRAGKGAAESAAATETARASAPTDDRCLAVRSAP